MLLIDWIKNTLQKNTAFLPLNPSERAIIHFVEETGVAVATGALIAGVEYFFGGGTSTQLALHIVEYAALKEAISAFYKYAQARGDIPLSTILQAVGDKLLTNMGKVDNIPPSVDENKTPTQ